jgi:DNA-binding CsgD family transcriptional regulator
MDQGLDHALAGWIGGDAQARVLTDANLTAYWVSASAEALINADRSVLRRNGRLVPRDPRQQRVLKRFVQGATAQVSSQCIVDGDTGDQIILTATRLPSPWEHLVGITLQRAGEDVDVHLADLHQAFGLTPTEARVVHRLFCGNTAEQVAEDMQVSLGTVRTHIKRAYAKLGVSSREGFFHKLTPFVISLR